MNVTDGNALLFKCGKHGYMNQTFSPNEVYKCGLQEAQQVRKEKYPSYEITYQPFLVDTPASSSETFTCGSKGYTNASYTSRDFYSCGFFEGKGAETNAGARIPTASHSLIKIMIFLMLITYAIV
ncbi:hypothetical protein SEUBUCD646_0D00160 [Saccharomyces eubayanus]|uniref:Uncharacterized protein n=2 Tax=Saccharomyces TaxID=4930 RepID=A0A6C1E3W5_SACPS|nr:hypothetical protein GRS66_006472 [Saccharomyces pastorianus]CAI1884435.1 hypothetical protein SEUBUCD650_0D00150 [Saccharomyces eubayanus]CAI1917975.1 hypothetical protein SEUBUCD646_0D00160 [Saccharomyces eubayanus]